jgi:hypothetical protein
MLLGALFSRGCTGQNFEASMTLHELFGVISLVVAIAGLFGPIVMLLK